MNSLKLDEMGGMPIELDDLQWEQNGIQKSFDGILKAFGSDTYVLYGVLAFPAGGGLWNVTAGAISSGGKVFPFAGLTNAAMAGGLALWGLDPVIDFDPTGNETFEDLSVHDTYIRGTLVLTLLSSASPEVWAFDGGVRLPDRVRAMIIAPQFEAWHILGDPGEPTLVNGYTMGTGDDRIMYRKEDGGVVRLRGILNASAAAIGEAFTLPIGYRPFGTYLVPHSLNRTNAGSGILIPVDRIAYLSPASGQFGMTVNAPAAADVFNLAEFPAFSTEL